MIAPNALIDDAVARFAHRVGLDDDDDRAQFEHQLASHSGVAVDALGIEQLVGLRDAAVIDEVVAFARHGVASPVSELVREVDRLLAQGL